MTAEQTLLHMRERTALWRATRRTVGFTAAYLAAVLLGAAFDVLFIAVGGRMPWWTPPMILLQGAIAGFLVRGITLRDARRTTLWLLYAEALGAHAIALSKDRDRRTRMRVAVLMAGAPTGRDTLEQACALLRTVPQVDSEVAPILLAQAQLIIAANGGDLRRACQPRAHHPITTA